MAVEPDEFLRRLSEVVDAETSDGAAADADTSGAEADRGDSASADTTDEEDLAVLAPVMLDEDGLTLNLGGHDSAGTSDEAAEGAHRPVTTADWQAFAEVEAELRGRKQARDPNPSLDRIELLMDYLGQPNHAFGAIHVAGTNGKTSTARMAESLLRAFHRRTGLFVTPELERLSDCIEIDGEPLHPADFVAHYEEIKPFVDLVDQHFAERDAAPMSMFEVLVGLAYVAFADAPVEVAVVETGMGGTWDATNVLNCDVSVITPIGLDHQDILGPTIEDIAAQKAGIITSRWDSEDLLTPPDNVAIIAEQDPAAMRVLLERAVAVDAQVARAGMEFALAGAGIAVGGQQIAIRGLADTYTDVFLPAAGEHQARNAALALAAVEAFFGAGPGRGLNADTVREGFAAVRLPGRLERVRSTPSTFVDAAHNPAGAAALAAAIERDFTFTRLVGVVAVFADKDVVGILSALEPVLNDIVVTQNHSSRCLDAESLAEYARDVFGEERVHVAEELPSAYALAVELAEDTEVQSGAGVLITGSVVTTGQARAMFHRHPED